MVDGFDKLAFSLAGGVSWGLGVLLVGLGSIVVPSWQIFVDWLGNFYIGYSSSIVGSIIGGIYGFFDVFIGLYVFLLLYYYFKHKLPSKT